jgi:hypothetical protein
MELDQSIGIAPSAVVDGRPAVEVAIDLAQRTNSGVLTDVENALLAGIETRLTEGMLRLSRSLAEFGSRAQAIGMELPETAQFCKLITSLLALMGFQFAHAVIKGAEKRVFLNDGSEYLKELGLECQDFIREVDLDGRRFLAIALIAEQTNKV